MDDKHVKHMKRCYELAISAGKKGYDTFGAVLVHNGKILEEAEKRIQDGRPDEAAGDAAGEAVETAGNPAAETVGNATGETAGAAAEPAQTE